MNNQIPYTSFNDKSDHICAPGNAVEFIQPWYTPISTTPENTGIAVGGIGNTFTLTPLGSTPNFSFIPGIFIDNNCNDFNFNDFYVSLADANSVENLVISDDAKFYHFLSFYPITCLEEPLVSAISMQQSLQNIKLALQEGTFYSENKAAFKRWNVEFSAKTQALLEIEETSLDAQISVAVDFFNGLLINSSAHSLSLSSVTKHKKITAMDSALVDFKALYPMAEFSYDVFDGISIKRKVVSPLVKGDKKLCSLPIHWNEFELINNSSQSKTITLVQSLKNLLGSTYRKSRPSAQDSCCLLTQNPIKQKHFKHQFKSGQDRTFSGVCLTSESTYASDIDGEILFGIEVDKQAIDNNKVTVSVKPSLYSNTEEAIILGALQTGRVNAHFDSGIYTAREALSAIACIQVVLKPGESQCIRFAQVMDHSKIQLQDWLSEKSYVQYYQANSSQINPSKKRAIAIMEDIVPQIDGIEKRIIAQQKAFYETAKSNFKDQQIALKFSTMAMNTLSFLAESSVWNVEDKFLVKECVDYPFFNSLDVYFYGSYSLLYLLPDIDGCVMKEFAKAILAEDATLRRFWEYEDKPDAELIDPKFEGVRAIRGAVIHDLGSPFDIKPDAYSWHNVKEWKDLAPKFILMVHRHFKQTGDKALVLACWDAVQESIDYLTNLIAEGDTLPLTRGTDDTFDNLASHGVSIYCASLWVAGLNAAAELASLLDKNDLSAQFKNKASDALQTLNQGLWNEEKGYFHFFVTPIQVKHLTGKGIEALQSLGLAVTGVATSDIKVLNQYLDDVQISQSLFDLGIELPADLSKGQLRSLKKQLLIDTAPEAFTPAYQSILSLDSDNSFGDALLADTYQKLNGLGGLFEQEKVDRALDYLYQHNFKVNSPKLGVANMTRSDGLPCEEFQAQDVWIGVQFSVASALRLAGKQQQAEELIDTVYDALYDCAKIPFAAPEGFNCSVVVECSDLSEQFNLTQGESESWLMILKETDCLLTDGRVSPFLSESLEGFEEIINTTNLIDVNKEVITRLHGWLQDTGMKYTAGRYFRPGMIFSYLPEALLSHTNRNN
tara:strand:- start:27421 stop:30609 length:3189 start_codon:yes stop_codon:yes gene_type:complete